MQRFVVLKIVTAQFLLLFLSIVTFARSSLDHNHSLTHGNADLESPLDDFGLPERTDITPDQYPACNHCSVAKYQVVAGCKAVMGIALECLGYCHVPEQFKNRSNSNPPTSGHHHSDMEKRLGEHRLPVPRERYIHSMEHGAVVLVYHCPQGCEEELEVLREVLKEREGPEDLVIMTPDPLLSGPDRFALISWNWLYRFNVPNKKSMLCYIDQHQRFGRECEQRICTGLFTYEKNK
jgi:hypothetical protein